ncbi:MAG: putative TetR transcriptional regulator [Bacteroidetes bacterium]|jgi:AcrR family transcriptional regulator|nr:putative TetR transcriptional regulator [Bacteroidota bacterium]
MMINLEKENSSRADLRKRIVRTSMEAFATRGVKSVTMDDVAMMLGISKRTLYEVFEDKETLLIECLSDHHDQMVVFMREVLETSTNVLEVILKGYKKTIEDYRGTNIRFLQEIKKYPKVYELVRNHRKRDHDAAVAFFKKGVEQGLFRTDVNFSIVHLLVHEQLDLLMTNELFTQYSFMEVYESITFTFLRGVSTAKGATILEDFLIEYKSKNEF